MLAAFEALNLVTADYLLDVQGEAAEYNSWPLGFVVIPDEGRGTKQNITEHQASCMVLLHRT